MKLFKVFAGIMGFFALFFGVSLFFPRTYKIEKSIEIQLPLNQTFDYLNTMENWKEWSPWNKQIDSTLVSFYSQVKSGEGATHYFRGQLLGVGRFRIYESVKNEKIHYELSTFDGNMKSAATFYFAPKGQGTELRWVDEGDVGFNPIHRYMMPGKISSTEKAFEDGLLAIKRAAEK